MKRETVPHKGGTDTGSAMGGVDEQRLHMPTVDQHEGQRVVVFINRQPEWRLRKETAHHLVNGATILRRQKIMSGVDRASPDFDDAVALVGAGTSDRDHDPGIHQFFNCARGLAKDLPRGTPDIGDSGPIGIPHS